MNIKFRECDTVELLEDIGEYKKGTLCTVGVIDKNKAQLWRKCQLVADNVNLNKIKPWKKKEISMKIPYSINEAIRDIETSLRMTTPDEIAEIYNKLFDDALSIEDGLLFIERENEEEED